MNHVRIMEKVCNRVPRNEQRPELGLYIKSIFLRTSAGNVIVLRTNKRFDEIHRSTQKNGNMSRANFNRLIAHNTES